MESCIKHTYLRKTWHEFLYSIDTFQVSWVVQRSKVRALLEGLQNLVGKNHTLIELLTTMHHTMTYCINLIKTLNHTNLWIGEQREDELYTLSMLRNVVHNLLFLTIGKLNLYESAIETYTLSTTTGHHALIVHVIQSVLN